MLSAGPSQPNSLFYEESPERLPMLGDASGTSFRDSITSAGGMLDGVDPDCVMWAAATSSGCRLSIKEAAISLTIPEGALSSSEDVYCAILADDKDRPHLTGKSSNL